RFDNRSPSYAGDVGIGINPKLAQRVKEADVLLVIGARLGEMTTSGYTLLEAPVPQQTLVHVHAGAEELGRVYRPALAINSGYAQFAQAIEKLSFSKPEWRKETESLRKSYLEWTEPLPMPGKLQYGEVIKWLSAQLPEDTIVAGGAGDFAAYARAFGAHGEVVERTEDFAPAFERARASGKPAILELRIDPDAITPATTLSAIREKARKAHPTLGR